MNTSICDNCSLKKGRKRKQCEIHLFMMKKCGARTHKIKSKVTLSFCPMLSKVASRFENILPCFRNDKKHYTPAFTLPIDDDYYTQNDEKYRRDHRKKVKDYCNEKSQLWQPKPNGKSNHCNVCKFQYQDYREHIATPYHHQRIKNNRFTGYIEEMVQQVGLAHKRRNPYHLRDVPSKYRIIEAELLTNDDNSKVVAT